MKRKLRGLVPLLVIAIGLLVLFYPTISTSSLCGTLARGHQL